VKAENELTTNRARVAQWFLCGDGIEIGALHNPMPVTPSARVKYVDRMSAEGLRQQYPELRDLPLVDADIIDNGEELSRVPAASQDFIIASHFMEHCQNPVATLKSFMRVLRPDGILFLVIPDKLYTFDKDRPSTTLEHIVRDYEDGPAWSREQHFREYARLVDHAEPGEAEELRARYLMDMDYSIHFHVWTKGEVIELLTFLDEKYRLGCELKLFVDNGQEGIYVVRKSTIYGQPSSLLVPEMSAVAPVPSATAAVSPVAPLAVSGMPPLAASKRRPSLWSKIVQQRR
jgi:predicted SAM-dependent methyltransferase